MENLKVLLEKRRELQADIKKVENDMVERITEIITDVGHELQCSDYQPEHDRRTEIARVIVEKLFPPK